MAEGTLIIDKNDLIGGLERYQLPSHLDRLVQQQFPNVTQVGVFRVEEKSGQDMSAKQRAIDEVFRQSGEIGAHIALVEDRYVRDTSLKHLYHSTPTPDSEDDWLKHVGPKDAAYGVMGRFYRIGHSEKDVLTNANEELTFLQ